VAGKKKTALNHTTGGLGKRGSTGGAKVHPYNKAKKPWGGGWREKGRLGNRTTGWAKKVKKERAILE